MTYFDERAKDWDSDPAKVERARIVAAAIRALLPLQSGLTALEVGCGTGLLSFALQPDFASITLSDTSEGMLAVLSDKIRAAGVDNMHPLRLDLSSDPLPASRFDAIYSLMTLHHIPDTDFILKQVYRLTNPGGVLFITDLEKEDGSFHGPAVTDVHTGFERAHLQGQLETAGFTHVRFASILSVKKLVAGVEKEFPLFLMSARKA
jgi:ubiquinone/menaquinone biosynthesis C-methylase UbiE